MLQLRRIKGKKPQIHQSTEQRKLRVSGPAFKSVNLSALDLEPNLKQFQKVDGEAQGTGAEVRMRHMERSSVPTVLSNWDKESTFEDNGMSTSQDNADQQDHSGVHCTDQCAEALMQESRVAEAGTQGLEAKLTSAIVKRKSESEQLARELKDWDWKLPREQWRQRSRGPTGQRL